MSDESHVIPLEELRVDDKLHFVEEPVEVIDCEIKQLKRSSIPIIKVRWNFKRGPDIPWYRGSISSRNTHISFMNQDRNRRQDAGGLSLEDKAHLTGGDYNTPCFQVILRFQ
ncbi:hypothetical protein Tco_1447240 [Tanacetum coccineum]